MEDKIYCDLCNKEIELKKEEIINGHQLVYDLGNSKKVSVFRCKECYEKDQSLTNYQDCQVFTRVVGYLRPVTQFNAGKQQEYKERKDYKLDERSK